MDKSAMVVFPMRHGEFFFLGKEYTLLKFPAREFLVITTKKVGSREEAMAIGHGQCLNFAKSVPIRKTE